MKRILAGFGVVGFLLFGLRSAEGCGDALVSLLTGVRYQRAFNASRRASVIVFSNGRASGVALTNPRLRATLKEVGHKVVDVQDSTQLDLALKTGRVDVLLVDAADVGEIARELQSTSNKPAIVPVFYKPSKADFSAAQRQYPFAIKASGDEIQFLKTIEAVMKSRENF